MAAVHSLPDRPPPPRSRTGNEHTSCLQEYRNHRTTATLNTTLIGTSYGRPIFNLFHVRRATAGLTQLSATDKRAQWDIISLYRLHWARRHKLKVSRHQSWIESKMKLKSSFSAQYFFSDCVLRLGGFVSPPARGGAPRAPTKPRVGQSHDRRQRQRPSARHSPTSFSFGEQSTSLRTVPELTISGQPQRQQARRTQQEGLSFSFYFKPYPKPVRITVS